MYFYPMEHLDMYHDFAEKLTASKKSVELDNTLRNEYLVQTEILADLKVESEKSFYERTIPVFLTVAALTFLIHLLLEGLWIGTVGLLLSTLFFVTGKIIINRKIKEVGLVNINRDKSHHLLKNTDIILLKKLNTKIVELRLSRFYMLLLMTCMLTPLILLSLQELLFEKIWPIHYALIIIIGFFPWMIYFHGNIDLLKKKKLEISKA